MLTSIYSCDLCGKEKTFEKFKCYFRLSHNCLICDSCYRKTYSALTSDCCSICETQLSSVDKSVIDAIIRGDRKDFGFCHNCERERPTDSFAVARKLSHWWRCRVCNDCFEIAVKAGPLEKCLVCKSEYSLNDIQTVLSHYDMNEIEILDHPYKRKEFTGKFSVPIDLHEEEKAPRRSQKSDVKSYTVTCTHEKSAYNALKCPNNCLCTLCFFKYYLLTGQGTCPTCGQRAPVPFPFEIQCSSCLRHYTPENVYKEGEALAVCTKGCVLCLYCVKTDERSLKCSVCDAPVETQAKKSVIETKQGVLHYACFCEVEDQGLEKLPCKHRIHTICRALIYDCRICGFHVNPRPTAFTISSFLI